MYLKNTNEAVDWKCNAIGAGANDGKPYKRLLYVKADGNWLFGLRECHVQTYGFYLQTAQVCT